MVTKSSTKKKTTRKTKKSAAGAKSGKSTKSKASKRSRSERKTSPAKRAVTVDRRLQGERRKAETENKEVLREAGLPIERRKKVNRRRQIDPTTCERDYSPEEIEFMAALDEYKRKNGRMFPTCSEILEVIRELGYQKPGAADDSVSADQSADQLAEQSSVETPLPPFEQSTQSTFDAVTGADLAS